VPDALNVHHEGLRGPIMMGNTVLGENKNKKKGWDGRGADGWNHGKYHGESGTAEGRTILTYGKRDYERSCGG